MGPKPRPQSLCPSGGVPYRELGTYVASFPVEDHPIDVPPRMVRPAFPGLVEGNRLCPDAELLDGFHDVGLFCRCAVAKHQQAAQRQQRHTVGALLQFSPQQVCATDHRHYAGSSKYAVRKARDSPPCAPRSWPSPNCSKPTTSAPRAARRHVAMLPTLPTPITATLGALARHRVPLLNAMRASSQTRLPPPSPARKPPGHAMADAVGSSGRRPATWKTPARRPRRRARRPPHRRNEGGIGPNAVSALSQGSAIRTDPYPVRLGCGGRGGSCRDHRNRRRFTNSWRWPA